MAASAVRRESHARFCERLEVKSLRSTHPTVPVLARQDPDRPALDLRARRPSNSPAGAVFFSPYRGGAHPEQHLEGYTGTDAKPTLTPALAGSTRPIARAA